MPDQNKPEGTPVPDEVQRLKDEVAESASAVAKAGESLLRKPVNVSVDMSRVASDVDAVDRAFGEEEVLQKESLMDFLRRRVGGNGVRVLSIGKDGSFVDVSEQVTEHDLRSKGVGAVVGQDGSITPLKRDPKTREEALAALREMVPSLRQEAGDGKSDSVRRMEKALEESDKILQHWRK